jgi:hypothetical protein
VIIVGGQTSEDYGARLMGRGVMESRDPERRTNERDEERGKTGTRQQREN